MKKIIITYLIVFSAPVILLGQQNVLENNKQSFIHQLSFDFGTHYNYFFGDRYIPPDTTMPKYPACYSPPSYVGKTQFSTLSFHFGLLYSFKLKNNIFLKSGLLYFNMKDNYRFNKDSIIKYYPDRLNSSLKYYSYSSNSFEIPLYIGYNKNRISGFIGTKIDIINIAYSYHKYFDGKIKKDFQGLRWYYHIFYPSIQLQYLIINKKIPISIYIASDMRELNYYDFQIGFEVILNNIKITIK